MQHETFQNIIKLLGEVENDKTVPRNIRAAVVNAKAELTNHKNEQAVRINSAISVLDEIANDTNIPTYTRTQIWNIVSELERLNQGIKRA